MERDGRTFFEDVRELPPGACLSFRPGDREPRVRRYWRLRDGIIDVDEREAVDTTHRLLHDSLSIRLRSDVPLGLSLSGGLDSTLLLALLNQAGYKDIPAFSSGYRESGYNETRYIDMARRSLACRPWSTAPTWRDFAADFERLIYHLDQPCKLPGPYSQWAVAKLAKDHVKVLLDGQGADELAGGYLYFLPQAWREAGLLQRLRHFPGLIATLLGNRHLLRQYAPGLIWERVRGRARAPGGGVPLRGRWAAAHARLRPFWEGDVGGLQAALRRSVTDTSLPPLLRYGDRVNMAFGIENRCPFLDHRLVEYVASLPVEMKIRGGVTKWIFRAVAEGRVPGGIAGRRMKMGFPTPVGVWLRTALAEQAECWLREYAGQPYFRLWLDVEGARRVLARHVAGAGEHQALLWRILAIGAWEKSAGLS
jgi:asparagine synthase (glutamine-hydrolysing)